MSELNQINGLVGIIHLMRGYEYCRMGLVEIGQCTTKLTLYEIREINYNADFNLRNLGSIISYFHQRASTIMDQRSIHLAKQSISSELEERRFVFRSTKRNCDFYVGGEDVNKPTEILCGFKAGDDYDRWAIVLPHALEYQQA